MIEKVQYLIKKSEKFDLPRKMRKDSLVNVLGLQKITEETQLTAIWLRSIGGTSEKKQ